MSELQAVLQDEAILQKVGLRLTPKEQARQDRINKLRVLKKRFFKASGLPPEELRVVRLHADTPVLRASFPWRTFMTPAVGAMIHWGKALKEFTAGKHGVDESTYNNTTGANPPMAMEVYVRKTKCCSSRVDYNLVLGLNPEVWNDAFEGFSASIKESTTTTKPSQSVAAEEPNDPVVET